MFYHLTKKGTVEQRLEGGKGRGQRGDAGRCWWQREQPAQKPREAGGLCVHVEDKWAFEAVLSCWQLSQS